MLYYLKERYPVSLKEYSSDNKIAIACSVMSKLHRASIPKMHQFPNIQDQLKALDQEWDLPKTYLQKARKLRDKLLQNPEPQILLHGDLYHENILQARHKICSKLFLL